LPGDRPGDRPARFSTGLPAGLALAFGLLLFANSLYLQVDSWFLRTAGSAFGRNLGIALCIGWIYFNQNSLLTRVLELHPLKYIGLISYGLYIFQGLFLTTDPTRTPGLDWPPAPTTGLVMLLVAAPLSYHLFEKPFLRLKSRFSAAPLQAAPQKAAGPSPALRR